MDNPNSSSKKWQLTFNNPDEKGLTHEIIKRILLELKSVEYFCMADEQGLETHTPHTHLFIFARSPILFKTIKKRFPEAHIERAHSSAAINRDYVAKKGKWENDPKADTSIPGTFEEWGELPEEPGQGFRTDIAQLYELIQDGLSNAEIMQENPELATHISKMDRIRQDILEARYKETWRDLEVSYIFGPTATGKTRGVMEKHGYSSVYRVTDYNHPFDRYQATQSVLLFDEFRSSLPMGDMLDYLDGYPMALPARYANRQACYTTVYLISNIPLEQQYPNVQIDEPATWKAFLRRIKHVIEYRKNAPPIDHGNATDYIYPPPPPVPDWVKEIEDEEIEQMGLPF